MPVSILAVVSEAGLPLLLAGSNPPGHSSADCCPGGPCSTAGENEKRSGVCLQAKPLSYETKVMLIKKPIKRYQSKAEQKPPVIFTKTAM